MKHVRVLVIAAATAAAAVAPAPADGPRTKLIELGWDIPDTGFLRENLAAMEAEGPFDGVVFKVEAKTGDGRAVSTQGGWNREPWRQDWFAAARDDLKACRFARFTDNFLLFNATPKHIAWTDDEGWKALEEKVRICAWLAREGGAKGLAADFEPYGENQWKYDPTNGLSFAETAALSRRRGAQFARGMAAELPDGVLMTLFLNSVVVGAGRAQDPDAMLAREHYGLLPAFLNGILDAAPAGLTIVDGCEGGYYMDSVEAYQRAALNMRGWNGPCARLVAPENRAKYRGQVQAGFGFYLDMFLNPEGNTYYRGPLDGSRMKRLTRNLRAARDASDGYVWVYGEQSRWWSGLAKSGSWREESLKKTVGRGRSWEEAMPGITRAIDRIRDPMASARAEIAALKSRGAASNLVANADFGEKPEGAARLPPHWSAWQDERNATGVFSWDPEVDDGAARAAKVAWGCFIQDLPVQPGEMYAVRAECRARGATQPAMTVRWQTADRRWTHETDDATFLFGDGAGEWKSAFGVVTVPPDTGRLCVLLGMREQRTESDVCWFDRVEVYRLEDPAP